jgi:NAD(P)H dehydrogenase (quinone)
MKTLIITAHPSMSGFTKRITAAYAGAKNKKGAEVEILDLYSSENRQDFLLFENVKEIPKDPSVARMQEKIKTADELVFVFPLWWYGEPAVMKNFWDKNFSARFAYRYENGRPIGLLSGKTARVFFTSDGAWYYQWLLLQPVYMIWRFTRLGLCGIKLKSFTLFDRMRWKNEEAREKMLRKVLRLANNN